MLIFTHRQHTVDADRHLTKESRLFVAAVNGIFILFVLMKYFVAAICVGCVSHLDETGVGANEAPWTRHQVRFVFLRDGRTNLSWSPCA